MSAHVALVSQSDLVGAADLLKISAAVQKQVQRDLAALWDITATVDAYSWLGDVPTDYWRVVIRDDIGLDDAAGAHWTADHQPFALVRSSDDINRVCHRVSHEVLEMLIDPSGNRMIAGASPSDPQARVNFIVEICDPTQGANAYPVNGLYVSDFVGPAYFSPPAGPAARYAWSGKVGRPHEVLDGGYLSWVDPMTDHLWQKETVGGQAQLYDRGRFNPAQPIRLQSDLHMRRGRRDGAYPAPLFDAMVGERLQEAAERRARTLEAQIRRLIRRTEGRGLLTSGQEP